MERIVLSLYAIVILAGSAFAEPRVSLLEALHVAEIRTARAASEWNLQEYDGEMHYRIEVPDDDSTHIVWVHAHHGRVSSVYERSGDKTYVSYRWPGVRVVAHRGGAYMGPPENTIAAFEKAIAIGADLIEIDIRETRDGHLVVIHDTTVDRTTNGSGYVSEMTLEEIRALDAGSWAGEEYAGAKVPTLKEALETMKGRIDPDLDFKAGDIDTLIRVVNEVGIASRCTHAGSWERNEIISQLEPRIRIRPTISYTTQIQELCRRLKPALINMDWKAVTEENIRMVHLEGAEAFVNTLGSADVLGYARIAALAGADYIQSDRPDLVIEMLEELGLKYDRSLDVEEPVQPLRNPRLGYPLR